MQFSNKKNSAFTEINITPLTDIFLVLLIIMMVIAPGFNSMDKEIKPPSITKGEALEKDKVTVSIDKEGVFYFNGVKTDESSMNTELEKAKQNLQKKYVVVKADEKTKSKEILKVMKIAQNLGYEKLIVAGVPLSAKEQQDLQKQNSGEK